MLKLANRKSVKIFFIIAVITVVLGISASAGYCTAEIAKDIPALAQKATPANSTILKFLIAMGGVIFSSLIIFGCLKLYNKFRAGCKSIQNSDSDDALKTPKNMDDAVTFFIKRNKLC